MRRSILVLTSFSSLVAITLGVVAAGALAFRYFERPWLLRIAAGPANSPDALFADAVQRLLPKGIGLSRIEVVRTDGASASASALDEGRADLAIVRSDVAAPTHGGAVLVVHKDAAALLVVPGSKIAKVADLKGKRVGITPESPANIALLNAVLAGSGLLPAVVQHTPTEPGQVRELVKSKLLDAVLVVSPLGDALLDEVVTAMSSGEKRPAFIEISEAEALVRRNPGLEKLEVPAGFFRASPPHPAEEASTVGISYQLVARDSLSDGTVTALTKRLFAMRAALKAEAPIARYMEAADTEKGGPYPLHPGAAAYYGDNEKSFMDRYGDWIYVAAMVLGGVGSALASFVSSWHARARRAAMAIIDDVMEVERKARDAASMDQTEQCGGAVDDAAMRALRGARDNRFDEAGLEAVRLAIDEARHAIRSQQGKISRAETSGSLRTGLSHAEALPG